MTDSTLDTDYEVVVVGGGPAGLSAALYSTRLGHVTALVDRGGGRTAMIKDMHNVVGVPESISGADYRQTGKDQLRSYGCDVHRDILTAAEQRDDEIFALTGQDRTYTTKMVVLATGMSDVSPDPPLPRTGRGLHYCLHCDAHMFIDEPVYVMGHGDSAVHVAAIMLNFTDDVDLLTHSERPTWGEESATILENHPIDVVREDVTGVNNGADGWLESIEFEDGTVREYRGGFAMYGSKYNNGLAKALGCSVNEDGTIPVDDHGRTDVDGVYAVGDVTPGHNQVPIAMGDGAKAGISIHWHLRRFPRELEKIETAGAVRSEEVPGIPDEFLEQAIEHYIYDHVGTEE